MAVNRHGLSTTIFKRTQTSSADASNVIYEYEGEFRTAQERNLLKTKGPLHLESDRVKKTMSIVPLAIAHAIVDKSSTTQTDRHLRVVNLMDVSGADRMQPLIVVCRANDVWESESVVTICSEPAFSYLKQSLERKLGVNLVFFKKVGDVIVHGCTDEYTYDHCLMKLDSFTVEEVDRTARAAVFAVEFV
jgi:hypothetical protein